jgi:hypothetical protein
VPENTVCPIQQSAFDCTNDIGDNRALIEEEEGILTQPICEQFLCQGILFTNPDFALLTISADHAFHPIDVNTERLTVTGSPESHGFVCRFQNRQGFMAR